jgi:hypothetical protein
MHPVGKFIDHSGLPGGEIRDAVIRARAAINKVHGVGEMLTSKVVQRRASPKTHGSYDPNTNEISIARNAPYKELTVLQEIGHKIHGEFFGFASGAGDTPLDKEIRPWYSAASRTRTSKDLARALHEARNPAVSAHLAYLAKPEEQFARDYSHYIALKSGIGHLLSQVRSERANALQYGHHAYRTDEEMRGITAAFDEIFALKGWI